MAKIPFVKYHGAGNDFIMIDDRRMQWNEQIRQEWVAKVCDRRFGIGADGLIMLQPGTEGADFFMKYYNADGQTSTFCGNGGRCLISFAAKLGINKPHYRFQGTDGWHEATMKDGLVLLSMIDVDHIEKMDEKTFVLFTGSPHYVTFTGDVNAIDVQVEGRSIRNSQRFFKEGINVNFVESKGPGEINIRTYERGVEDETFACGTGVVAAAIANAFYHNSELEQCKVDAKGGKLSVQFKRRPPDKFTDIWLIGPAIEVFSGEIEL